MMALFSGILPTMENINVLTNKYSDVKYFLHTG